MSDIKISASIGSLSFAYEGEHGFFEDNFGLVMDRFSELERALPNNLRRNGTPLEQPSNGSAGTSEAYQGTINTLVAKIGADSCSEVLKAAATHLTLYQGKDRFSADEWDETAKESNVWKADYSSQKSRDKKRLVDSGFVIENAKDTYSLSPSSRKTMEAKIVS